MEYYHGFLAAYSASTLQLESVINLTPKGLEGGVWESGDGPAIDSDGNIFISVGNGTFDNGNGDWGDSLLEITDSGSLTVTDSFTLSIRRPWMPTTPTSARGRASVSDAGWPRSRRSHRRRKDGNLYWSTVTNWGIQPGGGHQSPDHQRRPTRQRNLLHARLFQRKSLHQRSKRRAAEFSHRQRPPVTRLRVGARDTRIPRRDASISQWNRRWNRLGDRIRHARRAARLRRLQRRRRVVQQRPGGTRDQLAQGVKFAVPRSPMGTSLWARHKPGRLGLLSNLSLYPPTVPSNLTATPLSSTDIHLTGSRPPTTPQPS